MKPETITIESAHKALAQKEYSSVELTQSILATIEERNSNLNAYLEVFDDALDQAQAADEKIAKGENHPLTGIPLALKDNILQKGRFATAGSKILEGYKATYDATVTKKLRDQDVVFLGRTNLDEFAMGSSTENSAFGVVKNPHDETRVPGGSSGGSAAAVAMNGALATLGSDTGGSIRQPGSFCGVVGFKPTYGTVSRYGLIALGSSLDQIGPLTKTVTDAELVYNVIKGYDPLDGTSFPESMYTSTDQKEKLSIGVPRSFFERGVDEDVLKQFEQELDRLKAEGHTIVDISLPYVEYALPTYYVILPAEASANLERFDGVRYGLYKEGETLLEDYTKTRGSGFGLEPKRRILLGTYVLSAGYYDAYYGTAQTVRGYITDDYNKAFSEVDVIATPTTPTPAFKIGEKSDPLSMYLADIFTVPANLTGMPGISIPMGNVARDGKELPVGFQLIAPHLEEKRLFSLGRIIETHHV